MPSGGYTHAAPKTLDVKSGGALTHEIIHRYGYLELVNSALHNNFDIEGWDGPKSLHYRKKRDQGRSWLEGETSPNVMTWLEFYIESLSEDIRDVEIQEELAYLCFKVEGLYFNLNKLAFKSKFPPISALW